MPGAHGFPSVTEVLSAVGLGVEMRVSAARRDWYLARGRAVHAAIELDAAGELDEASIHPEVAPRVTAHRAWAMAVGHRSLHREIELVSPRWQLVGHPDDIGLVNSLLTLTDYKCSVDLFAARYQIALYDALWEEAHPDEPIEQWLALELQASGRFVSHPIDARAYRQAAFAAVIHYRTLEERRASRPVVTEQEDMPA